MAGLTEDVQADGRVAHGAFTDRITRVMDLDATHITVAAVQRLVPEMISVGGSFARWLPHPSTLTASARATALASAQNSAVEQCIRSLLRRAGLPEGIRVSSGGEGERNWPAGFVGSLTHKGTVVLGVISRTTSIQMAGIDLERMDGSDLGAIEHLVAQEGLPRGVESELGMLLVFSAKEAVFKAQYPCSRHRLDFSDVRLVWAEPQEDYFTADVHCPTPGLTVRCLRVAEWVLSAAIST